MITKKLKGEKYSIELSLNSTELEVGYDLDILIKEISPINPNSEIEISKIEIIFGDENFSYTQGQKKPLTLITDGFSPGRKMLQISLFSAERQLDDVTIPIILRQGHTGVKLIPPSVEEEVSNEVFWDFIKERTINFNEYNSMMEDIMSCSEDSITDQDRMQMKNRLPFLGVNTYSLIKFATEAYLKKKCGYSDTDMSDGYFVDTGSTKLLPYIETVYQKIDEYKIKENYKDCIKGNEIFRSRMRPLLIELFHTYCLELSGLKKCMNAISMRFQNIRNPGPDSLSRLDIDPLRPLNNIFWGYLKDELNRLSTTQRQYEYDHHYGLALPGIQPPINSVDRRSRFIESFHNLLYKCSIYFTQVDDMTRRADGFSILNSLRELHTILAEGAHNQFGDLPSTARAEVLIEQYILSRPEMREFLGGKIMVPYSEPWMDRVDTLRNMQGWGNTSVKYFNNLATYGEQLLLSIRYDNWEDPEVDATIAGKWATYWRKDIQAFIHSYFAVTGVDLSSENTSDRTKFIPPSVLIERKLRQNNRNPNYLVR